MLVQAQASLAEQWNTALSPYYDVVVVSGLAEALSAVRDGGFDVVVMDAANESIVVFANHLEQLPDAPPLVLASDSPSAPMLSAQVGAAGLVIKPCEGAELVGAVSRVIDTKVDFDLPLALFEDEPTTRTTAFGK